MTDEVQILRGPDLTVTDRRIIVPAGEIALAAVTAPQLEQTAISTSATPLVATIGGIICAAGLLAGGGPLVWVAGLAIVAFSALAKIRRQGFALTIDRDGQRQSIYTTSNAADAKLALAALIEAHKRAAA